MKLNLDTIRSLDANKSYYVSNKTGEIKEAGAWQKFKCALGIGDGRTKAAKLVDAVKTALLNEAGMVENDEMEGALDGLRNRSVSGSALKEIAERFAVANKGAIRTTMESRAVAEGMAGARNLVGHKGSETQIESLVRAAVSSCGGDREAAMTVAQNIESILVRGDARLRSAESVKAKGADIAANFAEMREAAKGDANILKFGAEFIRDMGGKALPKGFIANVIDTALNIDTGALKEMDGDSTQFGIHLGVSDFTKSVALAFGKCGAPKALDGAEQVQACRNFITQIVLAKLGDKTLGSIRTALATDEAKMLAATYDDFGNENRIPRDWEPEGFVRSGISILAGSARMYLDNLKIALDEFAGIPNEHVKTVDAAEGRLSVNQSVFKDMQTKGAVLGHKDMVRHSAAFSAKFKAMGYMHAEAEKLVGAASLYALATDCTVEKAVEEVLTPGTKANRLMEYGGRFTESVENFKDGLKLMDTLQAWFDSVKPTTDVDYKGPKTTTSQQFATNATFLSDSSVKGLEKFFFEDIAIDANFDLKETDPEKAFGMRGNAASRFFARGLGSSSYGSLAQTPPEKRRIIFAAADALMPLPKDGQRAGKRIEQMPIFIGRALKHLDELEAHLAGGTLTAENVVRTCYPEVADKAAAGVKAVNDFDGIWTVRAMTDIGPEALVLVNSALVESGASLDEVISSLKEGSKLPNAPYASSISYEIGDMDGLSTGGRKQMLYDFVRPSPYSTIAHGGSASVNFAKNPGDSAFGVTFPGGDRLKADGATFKDNGAKIADRIETLCGKGHAKQAGTVMFNLSQAALAPLKGGLNQYGIASNEHSPVEYSLSKDDATGAVKIDIKSPDYLPVKFSWSVTVSIDGTTSSTPMQIEKK